MNYFIRAVGGIFLVHCTEPARLATVHLKIRNKKRLYSKKFFHSNKIVFSPVEEFVSLPQEKPST